MGEGGEDFELRRLNGVASVAPREGSSIGNHFAASKGLVQKLNSQSVNWSVSQFGMTISLLFRYRRQLTRLLETLEQHKKAVAAGELEQLPTLPQPPPQPEIKPFKR